MEYVLHLRMRKTPIGESSYPEKASATHPINPGQHTKQDISRGRGKVSGRHTTRKGQAWRGRKLPTRVVDESELLGEAGGDAGR